MVAIPPIVRNVAIDARFPVALLPVRLETRLAGNSLKVRIYPDDIFADTHEPGLTPDEHADGAAYVASIGTPDEAQRWAALVAAYRAPRAAWIARASAAGSPGTRAESWTRAAQAAMPDAWLVRAIRGSQTFSASITHVRQTLALTLSPERGPQVPLSDALTVDQELEWTVHFDAAVAAGMAVTIDLTRPDAGSGAATPAAGIDVFVVGVNHDGATAGAARLRSLIDAQHYTHGFAFVAPGTPTSNSDIASTSAVPTAASSFAVERGAPLVAPKDNSNGERFARLLGLPALAGEQVAAVEHIEGAGRHDDAAAQAMQAALWPVTLGYFLEQMMLPIFDAATVNAARAYFLANVRPGGPLPAFRVGRVPYGLLPVLSLTRYAPDSRLSHVLRILRERSQIATVPRVTVDSTDPDGDLLKALAIDASCRSMRMRMLVDTGTTDQIGDLFGSITGIRDPFQLAQRKAAARSLLQQNGLDGDTRIGGLASSAADHLLGAPLVASTLSETTGVTYIHQLVAWAGGVPGTPADFASIRDDKLPGFERPLLYRLLRHSLLLAMEKAATSDGAVVREPDLVMFAATTTSTSTARSAAETTLAANTGARSVAEATAAETTAAATTTSTAYARIAAAIVVPIFAQRLQPFVSYLSAIASLPSAELDRRFGETLDACSHRIDAWITALATEKLLALRGQQATQTGCHTGAFGWVEGVRAAAPGPTAGGFIHAPSAAHASAAAILRNGYLSRGGTGSAYAVNLDSARTRAALELLDGVRGGEPLSALLGLRFERELHDRRLDRLIADLRTQFPLVAGRTPEGAGPVELVAATNVVDGLAVRAAKPQPAGLSTTEAQQFAGALASLDDAVDGVADLLTAESVYQAVRGNQPAATASLDAMAKAVLPPEPAVARTPLGGTAFAHRLVVALDGAIAAPAGATPRATAEPSLDAWLGEVLGALSRVGCRVTSDDGVAHAVTFDRLGLRPIDVAVLAKIAQGGDAELDRRVLDAAGVTAGRIDYMTADAPLTAGAWLELARAAAALVGGARALVPADLASPADRANTGITAATAADAAARAGTALSALAAASSALSTATPATLRAALKAAALFGVSGAYPSPAATADELAALSTSVQHELAARAARAPALTATDPATLLAAAQEAVTAVFGGMVPLLPRATPPAPTTLAAALAEAPALLRDPDRPRRLLQQVARVRPGVGRWRALFLYAEALGTHAPSIDVAQLPAGQSVWAADVGAAPSPGTVSLAVHRPVPLAPDRAWAGLVVDEWTELIPSTTQATSIAFRHETPVAEAPQAMLLAVSPTASAGWDLDTLLDTVRETLILAKVRLVEPNATVRPFLPAITLTGNTANETVSSNLLGAIVADPGLLLRSV